MAAVPQGIEPAGFDAFATDDGSRWRALTHACPFGIVEVDAAGACTYANPAFARLTGFRSREDVPPDWLHSGASTIVRVGDRSVRVQWIDGEGGTRIGIFEDVTALLRVEEQLEYDSTHDRLTGLGSRALLEEELKTALARTRRGGRGVALLFIDLDGFKRVNDMLGHTAGDELLLQVAHRLRATVRAGDLCVRLAGDEFAVCCPDMDSVEQCTHLADRVLAAVQEPFDVHGHDLLISASIGIATAEGDDPVSGEQLLSNAGVAAYRAKRLGRGRIEVFDEKLRRRLAQGRRVVRAVGRIINEPRVPMLCTPVSRLSDGAIVGFDCGVDFASCGLQDGPGFDLVVGEAGMTEALDVAVIRTVLAHLAETDGVFMSVALRRGATPSPVLTELVHDMIVRSRVQPASCWIGIADSAVARDVVSAREVAESLRSLGVRVALRDFGSAMSSLEQLRQIPAHALTIAGSFVETGDDISFALLRALVDYAHAVGCVVVADGVRDAAEAARLLAAGCDLGIGPAFGPVVAAEDVRDFRSL